MAATGSPAAAQTPSPIPTPPPAPDKSAYTLVNPTPRELMREMSTDRPDATESPYTVDAGHVQVELSFIDWSRHKEAGVTTRTIPAAPMLVKIGLTNSIDVAIGIDPYTHVRTTDSSGGRETAQGFGDITTRLRVNIFGNDDDGPALAIMPFLTFPTGADGLGSEEVEGGVIIPFGMDLPGGFALGLMAEFDFIRSEADDRYVVDFVHTATIGRDLIGDLAGYIEYAGFANLNHDQPYRAYFHAGLTYALSADIQLDGGVRVGLTDISDDIGLFTGVSFRF